MNSRVKYLDGIRGIAVLMVIAGHLAYLGQLFPVPASLRLLIDPDFGVNIFFALSGYLITVLLRTEKGGAKALLHFYCRRMFRLWPALLVFLTAVIFLEFRAGFRCHWSELLAAATFSSDLLLNGNLLQSCPVVGHTWSLTVEEVFYLAWAPGVFFLWRRGALLPALTVMALSVLATVAYFTSHSAKYDGLWLNALDWHVLSRIGAVACGALLAEALHRPGLRSWKPRPFFVNVHLLLALGFLWLLREAQSTNAWPYLVIPFRHLFQAGFTCLLIFACVKFPQGALARLLSFRPLAWCGMVSYSLYLWQQLFTQFIGQRGSLYGWQQFPLSVLLTFVCGALSFYAVESPLIRYARGRWGRKVGSSELTSSKEGATAVEVRTNLARNQAVVGNSNQ